MQAIAFSAIALFCLSLPLWATTDLAGLCLSIALFLVFGFMALINFRQMKATDETEMQYAPPADATEVEQVRIWAPIAFLYEQFGYWVATLSVPMLGLIVVLLFGRKIYLSSR